MDLEKRGHYIDLFDLYNELLTDKQRNYFISYYFDDLSLSEMSEIYEVSRNACHDMLKKTCQSLDKYEEKLKMNEKFNELKKALSLEDINSIKDIINNIIGE